MNLKKILKGSTIGVVSLGIALALPVAALAVESSGTTAVVGHVYNAQNNNAPVSGAQVNLSCNGQPPIEGNPRTTDANGQFTATYNASVCGNTDTVTASANKDNLSGNGSDQVQQLNASIPNIYIADPDVFVTQVPEFGLIPGALAAISAVGGYLGLKRRKF